MATLKRSVVRPKTAVQALAAVAFGVLWYVIAADYGYPALAGTYVMERDGETCTLILRADQTFSERLNHAGHIQNAEGRWRRFAEAGVAFSNQFLQLQGEELSGSGVAYGDFQKTLGLFPSLALDPRPEGPELHRKWLR